LQDEEVFHAEGRGARRKILGEEKINRRWKSKPIGGSFRGYKEKGRNNLSLLLASMHFFKYLARII
jgi:hypothetical protein